MPAAPAAPPTAPASTATPAAAPRATAPAAPASAPAPAAAKPTNQWDESMADMERLLDDPEPKPPAAPKPAAAAKPKAPAKPASPVKPPAADPNAETEPEGTVTQPGEEQKPGEEVKPPTDGKPADKESPWKLVDKFKKRTTQLEKENAELRARAPEVPKEVTEKLTSIEARNKELEDEIRFVNYKKSKEFADTYQKPYEEAWANALAELQELTITNEDGTARAASASDLLALANMPLGQARATAKQWFGDSADDVMSHRRVIKELYAKQNKALEDAQKNSGEREQQRMAEMQAKQRARNEEHARAWKTINDEETQKYEFLRPAEGETERNERLEKATKFVDETFGLSVAQAKTQEERDQILRRHAAIRNRAIGFSVLRHENKALKAELDALRKELAEFQGSEPVNGHPRTVGGEEEQPDTLEGAVAGLARLAS